MFLGGVAGDEEKLVFQHFHFTFAGQRLHIKDGACVVQCQRSFAQILCQLQRVIVEKLRLKLEGQFSAVA